MTCRSVGKAGGSLSALSTLAGLVANETDPGRRERLLEALEELHAGQLAVRDVALAAKEEQLVAKEQQLVAKEQQLVAKEQQLASERREMSLRLDIARSKEREARREVLKAKGLFHIRGFLGR